MSIEELREKINNVELIAPILKFLNTDDYYNKIIKISRDNILTKMNKNYSIKSK